MSLNLCFVLDKRGLGICASSCFNPNIILIILLLSGDFIGCNLLGNIVHIMILIIITLTCNTSVVVDVCCLG